MSEGNLRSLKLLKRGGNLNETKKSSISMTTDILLKTSRDSQNLMLFNNNISIPYIVPYLAKIAATSEISHSGALKPIIDTPLKLSKPS